MRTPLADLAGESHVGPILRLRLSHARKKSQETEISAIGDDGQIRGRKPTVTGIAPGAPTRFCISHAHTSTRRVPVVPHRKRWGARLAHTPRVTVAAAGFSPHGHLLECAEADGPPASRHPDVWAIGDDRR